MADNRSSRLVDGARVRAVLAVAVAALLVGGAVASGTLSTTSWASTQPSSTTGVLQADPRWEAADHAAGLRLAVANIDWARWQPGPHRLGLGYIRTVRAGLRRYRDHGWQIDIDPGLQQPPPWVLHLPEGQLRDEWGNRSGTPNYEFSSAVRVAAGLYLHRLVTTLGPVGAYRVGVSVAGEVLYPPGSARQWWGYGRAAQTGVGLATTEHPSPLPGWVPGQALWRGRRVDAAQIQRWYDWYLGGLVSAVDWEMNVYRSAGFSGQLQLVMPGDGAGPSLYSWSLAHGLAPSPGDPYHTMNSGAVWWRVLELVHARGPLAVDISSVGDPSGLPGERSCRPGDDRVPLASADPSRSGWSDTRWLAYLARQHDMGVVGENPGNTPPGGLARVMELTASCRLSSLMWAWDYELHGLGHQPSVSLAQLSAAVRSRANGGTG